MAAVMRQRRRSRSWSRHFVEGCKSRDGADSGERSRLWRRGKFEGGKARAIDTAARGPKTLRTSTSELKRPSELPAWKIRPQWGGPCKDAPVGAVGGAKALLTRPPQASRRWMQRGGYCWLGCANTGLSSSVLFLQCSSMGITKRKFAMGFLCVRRKRLHENGRAVRPESRTGDGEDEVLGEGERCSSSPGKVKDDGARPVAQLAHG